MKFRILLIIAALATCGTINSQAVEPVLEFSETAKTFSMHICSDGMYYYTVNGGVPEDGCLFKYDLQGKLIKAYPLKLDMRGISYNGKDKSLYVNTKDKKIFRIIDLEAGTYELVFENLYDNAQSSLAIDPKGKYIYALDSGSLSLYKFKTGELVKVLAGLKCGDGNRKGAGTVALIDDYIYTWDADSKTVYVYNHDGIFIKSFILKSGDLGYSLSQANGLIFVSRSEKGKKSTWYGYDLKIK
jgi:hypothetical protein